MVSVAFGKVRRMGNSASGWDVPRSSRAWHTNRTQLIAVAVVVTLIAVGAVLVLRGGDDGRADAARSEVEAFLSAWADGKPAAAARRTDDPKAAASLLESVTTNLAAERTSFEVSGAPKEREPGEMTVPFTATFTLEGVGRWAYDSAARAMEARDGSWTVVWESSLVHPRLREGQTLVRTLDAPDRAPILAADGTELAGPATVWDISIWPARLSDPDRAYHVLAELDADIDTDTLADRVTAADPDQAVPVVTLRDEAYQEHAEAVRSVAGLQSQRATRPVAHLAKALVGGLEPGSGEGTSGLQARYDDQLAGTPSAAVVIADRATGEAVRTLREAPGGEPGTPVETTIDPGTQRAAEAALEDTGRAGAIVVVRPSTGHVLASADRPDDGLNRSLTGQYPPGSTFKIVTAAALLEHGVAPDDALGCPRSVTVDGQRFHNQNEFELGPGTTLHDAFTASCNTAFIQNRDRLAGDALRQTAAAFGIGGEWQVGAATFDGSVPVADGANDLAASLIGQGRVQASPLVVASVAATVAEGRFRQPVLVPDAVDEPYQPPAELSPGTVDALRTMMRDTVREGTASALREVPGGPHAKTGTAEFAREDGKVSTHAWLVGYLAERDLAFAVLLEDGGSGGADAGPLAADFLTSLPESRQQ